MQVSAIITTHGEGELVIPSVLSCDNSTKMLEALNISYEKILVMDRPTDTTRTVVERLAAENGYRLVEYDYGDQGQVRNDIVTAAEGRYIAFLDGDDLWSENWLLAAYQLAEQSTVATVVYPEFNWFFEDSYNILCQVDHHAKSFDHEALRGVNLWDALCFCPKEIFLQVPFAKRQIDLGFAYEDWNWNRRLHEHNITQLIASDTIIFKRRRDGSQGTHAANRGVIAQPSASCFFDFYE